MLGRAGYRMLIAGRVDRALGRSHFRIRSVHRQFVLPMWFHRAIGSRHFTAWLEDVFDRSAS